MKTSASLVRGLAVCLFAAFGGLHLDAQVTVSGVAGISAGGALLDGDRPAFQETLRLKKDGYGGLETLTVARSSDESLFRVEGRLMPGLADYRGALRFERFDAFYVDVRYKQFRTFYDGSGGFLRPRSLAIPHFDEDLALDRSYLSAEFGTLLPNRPQFVLRYERTTRSGAKDSIRWGDSNLAGAPFSPRAFIPSYLLVDEVRTVVTAELSHHTDSANWNVTARRESTDVDNRHVGRRRALEPQDRYVTTTEGSGATQLSGHAHYERQVNENLRWSAGGLATDIDTNLTGSKIYGGVPDAEYSATFARRQGGDVGYYGLQGSGQLRQYVGNLNVWYRPVAHVIVRPGLKYEHLRAAASEDHTDTNFSGAALTAVRNQQQGASRDSWNEVTEDLEVRFTRWPQLGLDARAVFNQGRGGVVEQSIIVPTATPVIDRDADYRRVGQRYTVNANWSVRPGLTLGAQYNYRLKMADYRAKRDNTSNAPTSGNRYPSYIIDNDVASGDFNVRLAWRPRSMLSFVTRYAQQSAVTSTTFEAQPEIDNGRLQRRSLAQSVIWNPTARLHLNASVGITRDRLGIPTHRLTVPGDNDFVNAALGAGYALGKVTDLFLDASHYRADNFVDNSEITLPLNSGQRLNAGYFTWVRREGERLVYTARYGYVENQDRAFMGLNDFRAHLLYGKVQYKF
jgi:hypothetical protein